MAHHHLGQPAEARAALAEARTVVKPMTTDRAGKPPLSEDWSPWIEAAVLLREAERLIDPAAAARPPGPGGD